MYCDELLGLWRKLRLFNFHCGVKKRGNFKTPEFCKCSVSRRTIVLFEETLQLILLLCNLKRCAYLDLSLRILDQLVSSFASPFLKMELLLDIIKPIQPFLAGGIGGGISVSNV